jgi:hypothetical protein
MAAFSSVRTGNRPAIHWPVVAAAFAVAVAGLVALMGAVRRDPARPKVFTEAEEVSPLAEAPPEPLFSPEPAAVPVEPQTPVAVAQAEPPPVAEPAPKPAPDDRPVRLPEPPADPPAPAEARVCQNCQPPAKAASAPGRYGTAVDFVDDPTQAARKALQESKLLFILHVAGNFEDDKFT